MPIFDLDELPSELHPQLSALRWLDGESPQDLAFVRRLQRAGFPATKYFGVYAVENGEVLAHVETLALPYRSGPGLPGTVLGIADVLTQPDALGRGLARRLLVHLHRREAAQGREWSFLWTHRSWGAHRLYERLGYRDVYSPPSAVRKLPSAASRRLPRGYSWRRAAVRDLGLLERLLGESTEERLGFVPRWKGSFRLKDRLGWRPVRNHLILGYEGAAVGYASVTRDLESVAAHEVVVRESAHARAMLAALEREASGRWLTFGSTSFVAEFAPILTERKYALHSMTHVTLMARPLRAGARSGPDPAKVAADPAYSCHRGDQF